METHNTKIEESVLGALISRPKETRHLISEIYDEYFFGDKEKKVFQTIRSIATQNKQIDPMTVSKEAGVKFSYIAGLIQNSSNSGIKNHIQYLKEYADNRWFYGEVTSSISLLETRKASELMNQLANAIIARTRGENKEQTNSPQLIDAFEAYQSINREHIKSGNQFIGLPSGFNLLDNAINGIRNQHYWIVTAYTNVGKSYFLLNIVNNILNQGKRVIFFSLEMSKEQNIARLLGIKTMIDPTEIEKGTLDGQRLDDETQAKAELYEQKLTLYNQKNTIEDILITIYAEHSIEPIDLIVIDYIQKIRSKEAVSRYERFTNASDSLQKLCQEIGVPAIVASQIDNESAKTRNREIISTKGSGDIGADADLSIKLQSTENEGEIECIIQKNRHGYKGYCNLKFGDGGILKELNQ